MGFFYISKSMLYMMKNNILAGLCKLLLRLWVLTIEPVLDFM